MAKLLLIISLVYSSLVQGQKLQTGDVLLQPLSCWSCGLIEQQENSQFSHIGIFIRDGNSEFVYEALGSVRRIPLGDFLKRTKKAHHVIVLRSIFPFEKKSLKLHADKLLGLPVDKAFRWDNFINDKEQMYCSEFVYKLLKNVLALNNTSPKRMFFNVNPLAWDRYFNNDTPRGELGLSPEDFNQSDDFFVLRSL